MLVIYMAVGLLTSRVLGQQHSPFPERADTLNLRDICGYCIYGEGGYATAPFSPYNFCVCHGELGGESPRLRELLIRFGSDTRVLNIENPSKVAAYIPWEKFSRVEVVYFFGNDSDYMIEIPPAVFKLHGLKQIFIYGIKMDQDTWHAYSLNYPQIEFIGEVDSY